MELLKMVGFSSCRRELASRRVLQLNGKEAERSIPWGPSSKNSCPFHKKENKSMFLSSASILFILYLIFWKGKGREALSNNLSALGRK